MKHTLKQIVDGNEAHFTHACEGKLYYAIFVDDAIYQVELNSMAEEWKTVYILPVYKAIYLMRWIRKGIENNDGTFIQLK